MNHPFLRGDQVQLNGHPFTFYIREVGFWEQGRKKREDNGESYQWKSRIIWSRFRSNVSNSSVITTANSAPCSGVRPVRLGKSKNTVNSPASLRAEGGACIFVEISVGIVTACRPKKMLWWQCGGRTAERVRSRFKTALSN